MYTSFPRDYKQHMLWIVLHYPTSFAVDSINSRLLVFSVTQDPIIIIAISIIIKTTKGLVERIQKFRRV